MDAAILRATLLTPGSFGRWGLPLLNWGPPAVAKTAQVFEVAEEIGLRVETLLGSTRQVEDFLGNPYFQDVQITDGNGCVRMVKATAHAMPDWGVRAFNDPYVLIHLDEVSLTSTDTQKGLLRLVHEGCVGEVELPKTVRFLGSANPSSMAAGTFDMTPPLVARWGHAMTAVDENLEKPIIDLSLVRRWAEWAMKSGGDRLASYVPEPPDQRAIRVEDQQVFVLSQWDKAYADVRGSVASFMLSSAGGASALYDLPPPDVVRPGVAWPNGRMWEYAMRAMASAQIHGLTQMQADLWASMFVGAGPIGKYNLFKKDLSLPSAEDFLCRRIGFVHDPLKLDRTLVLLNACSMNICDPQCQNSQVKEDTFWGLVQQLMMIAADICIPAVKMLVVNRKTYAPMARTVLPTFIPMLKAAGAM